MPSSHAVVKRLIVLDRKKMAMQISNYRKITPPNVPAVKHQGVTRARLIIHQPKTQI